MDINSISPSGLIRFCTKSYFRAVNKRLCFSLFCILCFIPLIAEDLKWGEPYIFEADGKYGLLVNEEVALLPTFEKLRKDGEYFIFEENGKEGLLRSDRILYPAVFDKITGVYKSEGNIYVRYTIGDDEGLLAVGHPRQFITFRDEIKSDTVPDIHILPLGEYTGIKSIEEVNGSGSLDEIIFCLDKEGKLNIIDLTTGINYTPYYEFKKLNGNIKDFLNGKIPYSKLNLSRSIYSIRDDFKKIRKKHPEIESVVRSFKSTPFYVYSPDDVLDSISDGPFDGILTYDGVITIPYQYSSLEDVYTRNPNNFMVTVQTINNEMDKYRPSYENRLFMSSEERWEESRKLYNNQVVFYEACIPIWQNLSKSAETSPEASEPMKLFLKEKVSQMNDKLREATANANKYNKIGSITGTMTNIAQGLSSVASSISSGQGDSAGMSANNDYTSGSNASGNKNRVSAKDSSGSGLSDQTNYNRDKKTYERYDSQLSSHYAGNQTMSPSSVDKAKREMKRLREKWEAQGKSFPHSSNENR